MTRPDRLYIDANIFIRLFEGKDELSAANLWSAAAIRARYSSLKLPDAIHLATALQMNCSHFLSADTRLKETYELDFRHWGMVLGPATIEVVRPDLQRVQAMVDPTQT